MPRGRPRAAEARGMESREAEQRRSVKTGYVGQLYFDPNDIPKGMRYRWKAMSVLNQPLDGNIQRAMMEGWKPVPADRHPLAVPPTIPGRDPSTANIIVRGGQILMERPEKDVRADQEELRRENLRQLESVNWDSGLNEADRRTNVNQVGIESRGARFRE